MRHALLLVMVLLLGIAVGVWSRPPGSIVPNPAPKLAAPGAPATTGATLPRVVIPAASGATPPAPAAPASASPIGTPLPGAGPLAPLLKELRERARRGDVAAARRAHRDLYFCETAPHFSRGSEPHDLRVRCVAEQLCAGLQDADYGEAGGFLLRAAELGDVEAMAAVAGVLPSE